MSFYDDAKFMFLAGGAAGKDGKIYNVKPVEELSSTDLVINGDFSIDGPLANGELGTGYGSYGWNTIATNEVANQQEGTSTIANGVLTLTNGAGDVDARAYVTDGVSTRNVVTINTYYRLRYRVVENTDCTSFRVYHQGGQFVEAPGTVGEHTLIIRNTTNQLFLFTNSTESSSISIDNVSLKEITNQLADFTFSRGTNLTATRVGKDGYIEKGREQKVYNTVWAGASEDTAPTGWTASITADGTFNTTSTSGQIRFTSGASDRSYIQGPAFTTSGPIVISVYVDEVYTACRVGSVIGFGGVSSSEIGVFEDNVKISLSTNVKAGKRYSFVVNRTDSDNGYPRFGVGIDNVREGDITLSRPQFEVGLAATAYIENTSTSATATAGLLEDEPRFDYTGGGCPALLIEGNAINLVKNSEYLGDYSTSNATITTNALTSPEGLDNATTIDVTSNSGSVYAQSGGQVESVTAETEYTFSFYVKQGTNTENYLAVRAQNPAPETFISQDVAYTASTTEWKRISHTFTTPAGCTSIRLYPQRYSSGGQGTTHIWGMQLETGSYATSYIPTYGSSATRTYDDPNDLVHGITMGTSCSFFLEATNFKVTETGGAQTSFLKMRAATSPTESDRFLFLGVANTASTFTLQAQNKESGTPATDTLSKTGLTMGSPFKALARYDGTSFDLFVNGVLEGSAAIVADDHFGRVELKNLTSQTQNGHSISQVILFDYALSTNDSEIITGTSYTNFAVMASELSYTEYE